MTDREVLELAAKAAEKDIDSDRFDEDDGFAIRHMAIWWNPLTDDGDALRLAVKLKFLIDIDTDFSDVGKAGKYVVEMHDGDDCAATRRAVVRAAAEIGKEKA